MGQKRVTGASVGHRTNNMASGTLTIGQKVRVHVGCVQDSRCLGCRGRDGQHAWDTRGMVSTRGTEDGSRVQVGEHARQWAWTRRGGSGPRAARNVQEGESHVVATLCHHS
jgi:hypothetical protein